MSPQLSHPQMSLPVSQFTPGHINPIQWHHAISVSRQALNDVADGKEKSVICAVYGIEDGMLVSEGNGGAQPAGWRTSAGKLWFTKVNPKVKTEKLLF